MRRFQLTPDGSPDDAWLCCTTRPDGTAYNGNAPKPQILLSVSLDLDLSLDEAEAAARTLLAAVSVGRGGELATT